MTSYMRFSSRLTEQPPNAKSAGLRLRLRLSGGTIMYFIAASLPNPSVLQGILLLLPKSWTNRVSNGEAIIHLLTINHPVPSALRSIAQKCPEPPCRRPRSSPFNLTTNCHPTAPATLSSEESFERCTQSVLGLGSLSDCTEGQSRS